jgi:uncharacterized membrane protein
MKLSETKKDARLKLTGKWPKALAIMLIYLVITLALEWGSSYIVSLSNNNSLIQLLIYLVVVLASIPLAFGLTSTFIDLSRDKKVSYTDFINKSILNFSKVWAVTFRIFLKVILPILICIAVLLVSVFICAKNFGITDDNMIIYQYAISIAYIIIMLTFFIRFLPYALSFMILADHPELDSKAITEKSSIIMKNKKLEYFLLCLSFIGWILLIGIVAAISSALIQTSYSVEIIADIGIIILSPYILTSQITYYEDISDETVNEDNKEKEISENK